jgi:hypothetical protein
MARKIDDELREMLKEEHSTVVKESDEPSTLMGRWFQEADDDDNEDEGESLEDIEKDMDNIDTDDDSDDDDDKKDDDEDDDIGKDDSDVQNEYDDNDLNALNELIADEQHAMQQYFKAGKETKNVLLSRLYNDIGAEEAFHSEQLLYAKAELTGEKYEPSDPEVKKEYEELLENGMDEETAMYTIADKHKLDGVDDEELDEDLEDIAKDMESLSEGFVQTMANLDLLMTIQETAAYKNHADLRQAYYEFAENVFIQEAVDNVATKKGSEILGTNNPFIIVGRAIKSVYMFIINLVKKLKNWINKRRIKSKRALEWLKRNGIKGLFSSGVKLYFWNPQTNEPAIGDAMSFITLCMNVTSWVAKAVGIAPPTVTTTQYKWMYKLQKPEPFTSILDGKSKIDGAVFSKTKVIVNDSNAGDLERQFFGFTEDVTLDKDGNKHSINIYNALTAILEVASDYLKASEAWTTGAMTQAAGQRRGIAYTKPEVYKQCVDAMKSVAKGYSKLAKCLTSDIDTCMKLDQGLLNAVNNMDKSRANGVAVVDSGAKDSNGNIRYADKEIS